MYRMHKQLWLWLWLFVIVFPLYSWPNSHLGQATLRQTCASHIWWESGMCARKPLHAALPTIQPMPHLHALNILNTLNMHNQFMQACHSCNQCNALHNNLHMPCYAIIRTCMHAPQSGGQHLCLVLCLQQLTKLQLALLNCIPSMGIWR